MYFPSNDHPNWVVLVYSNSYDASINGLQPRSDGLQPTRAMASNLEAMVSNLQKRWPPKSQYQKMCSWMVKTMTVALFCILTDLYQHPRQLVGHPFTPQPF